MSWPICRRTTRLTVRCWPSSLTLTLTPTRDSAGDGHAWADLLKELELALEAAGLPLRDAWIIGAEFWRNAYCTDPECCGVPGRPVEQIRNSRLNAEMVYRGSSVGAVPGAPGTQPGAAAGGPRGVPGRVRLGGAIRPATAGPGPIRPGARCLDDGHAGRHWARTTFLSPPRVTLASGRPPPTPGPSRTPGRPIPGPLAGRFSSHRNSPATCGPACAFRHGGTRCS